MVACTAHDAGAATAYAQQQRPPEPNMSVLLPFLALLLAGLVIAYHRMRLAVWVATCAVLLTGCWLFGASHVAVATAAVLVAIVAIPLLVPAIRKPQITAPLL